MKDTIDDQTALEDMRQGGTVGFETLYKRYFPRLRKQILQLLVKYQTSKQVPDIADEICQEVFYAFYQNIKIFEERCLVITWLSRLAYNKTIDYLRKEKKEHPQTWLSHKTENSQQPVVNREQSLEQETEDTFLKMVTETMEQDEKIFCYAECISEVLKKSEFNEAGCFVILIFYLQGESIENIAEEMAITHKEAKTLLTRCQKRLKKSPNCLMVLMLFYELGLSQNEMATLLDKKSGTTGVFLHECKNKLKNDIRFKKCCEECDYLPKE